MELILILLSLTILLITYWFLRNHISLHRILNPIKPIHYFLITSSLFFSVKSIILFSGVQQSNLLFYNQSLSLDTVNTTLFYAFLHIALVVIAYRLTQSSAPVPAVPTTIVLPGRDRINFVIVLYILIGILAMVDRVKTGTFFFIKDYDISTLKHYVWWYIPVLFGFVGGSFYLFGVTPFLAFAAGYYRDRGYVVLYYVFSVIYIFVGLYSGQKEVIYSVIVIYLFYSYYLRSRVGHSIKREVWQIIPVLIFIFFLPNLSYYRMLLVQSTSRVATQNIIIAMRTKQESEYIFKRMDHLDAAYSVVKKTPDAVPYKMGETYFRAIDAVTIYLPFLRAYYPYRETVNNSFANDYGLIDETVSGITLPIFAEAYMNFGVVGIVLISLLYGWLLAKINRLIEMPHFHLKFVGFILLYVFVIQFNALSFQSVLLAISRDLVSILIVVFLLKSKEVAGPLPEIREVSR